MPRSSSAVWAPNVGERLLLNPIMWGRSSLKKISRMSYLFQIRRNAWRRLWIPEIVRKFRWTDKRERERERESPQNWSACGSAALFVNTGGKRTAHWVAFKELWKQFPFSGRKESCSQNLSSQIWVPKSALTFSRFIYLWRFRPSRML